ncbi:DUF1552 domain-containing protein [Shewanella sp. 10N.7]|uniref:DUF1552 domain-containing protein n=1 Tax=Shewanella sp. 10N.7 TaxID=2885093 RepID=UPI001E284C0B|nr:DUF1552 domain-containing protein [Shewanella sp. 10N.7]MCC4831797.1 DUF1552 domain-containing protein [Shewanella sp. 10N.7]
MKKINNISRRQLLKASLAGIAIPSLASLPCFSNNAIASTAKNTLPLVKASLEKPARLVTIFFPNGVSLPPEKDPSFKDWHWFPHHPGKDYVLTNSLLPLQAHRENMSILSGFSHPKLRSMVPHSCSAQFLTGADQSHGYANAISYDQVFANAIDGATRYSSLALSSSGGTGSIGRPSTISINRDGALMPTLSEPREIYNRLFGIESGGLEQKMRAIARERTILERVSSHLASENLHAGAAEQAHLNAYLSASRTLDRQLERANEWLNVPKPEIDPSLFDFNATPSREMGTNYLQTMFDLIHMALLTDSTRVVTYQTSMEGGSGRGNQLPYAAGLSLHHHKLSHAAAQDEGGWERWAKFDQYLAQRFSEYLTKMAETPDPLAEGSLLDNTIVLYGCGTSKTHVGKNYPLIVAGGSNLGLKHGAFHKYDEERPFNDLLLTLLQKVGVEIDSFGDSENIVADILV